MFIAFGAVTHSDCFISNESIERGNLSTGITTILASQSSHDLELSGNDVWTVTIQNKFGAAMEPSATDTGLNRQQLDERVGRQLHLMMQASDNSEAYPDETCSSITYRGRSLALNPNQPAATNDADMAEFTCLFLRYMGATRGRPDDNSCAWIEARNFEITACPSAV
jgi:hypothetical protein